MTVVLLSRVASSTHDCNVADTFKQDDRATGAKRHGQLARTPGHCPVPPYGKRGATTTADASASLIASSADPSEAV